MASQTPPSPNRGRVAPAVLGITLLVTLALALAACGGDGGTTEQAAVPTQAATAPAPVPTTSTTQPAPPTTTRAAPATDAPKRATTTPAQTTPQPRTPQTTPAPPPPAEPAETTPAPARPAPSPDPEPAGTPIDELAELTLVSRLSPAHYTQQGTVTGTVEGDMAVEARITDRGVVVDFTVTASDGSITGRALAIPVINDDPMAALTGSAAITGGTGRYAGISGRRLSVSGKAMLDGSRATVRLAGAVTY